MNFRRSRATLFVLVCILFFGVAIPGYADESIPSTQPNVERSRENPAPLTYPLSLPPEIVNLLTVEEDSELISPQVVGGSEVTPENAYPWVGYLKYYEHYCGGTLIDAEWVLTAAHCWVDPNSGIQYPITEFDKVVLGEHNLSVVSGREQELGVAEVYVHPGFDMNTFENDFALMKLSTPATLNDYVQPIQLSNATGDNLVGLPGLIAGWGTTLFGGTGSDDLLYADIDILADSDCSNYGSWYQPSSMLCAGKVEGGKDACQGDSGGALAYQDDGVWNAAGIVSWGEECGLPGYPGVYSRIFSALDWIYTTSGIATQLITDNRSFEQEIPADWLFSRGLETVDHRDCSEKILGSCSWQFNGNGTEKRIIYHYRPDGKEQDTFNFSIWRKGLGTSGTGFMVAEIRIIHQDGSFDRLLVNLNQGTVSSWEKITDSIVASEPYQLITISIAFKKGGGTLWVDDVRMQKNDELPQIVANSSFELSMPKGWGGGVGLEVVDGRDCTIKHTGNCAWELTGNSSEKRIIYHHRPDGNAEDIFDFRLWRKGLNTSGAGYIVAEIRIIHQDLSFQRQLINLSTGDISKWEQFTYSMKADEPYQLVTISVVYKKPGGSLWVDDIDFYVQP